MNWVFEAYSNIYHVVMARETEHRARVPATKEKEVPAGRTPASTFQA
jgi:hypothetical protein